MSDLPNTIKNPDSFLNSPSAGFDGVFDWSWTDGCFGAGKIKPMDFDGVVERRGNFLLFETKNMDVSIPKGQLYTLQAAHALGCFTIMLIHGKTSPERMEIWFPGCDIKQHLIGKEAARQKVGGWYAWADANPRSRIDIASAAKLIALGLRMLNGTAK
jgi:hypothetical protein